MHSPLRISLVAALLAVLVGCSAQRLAYNQADWLLLNRLDAYLDLTDEQEDAASAMLQQAHLAHRRNQLPVLANALEDVSQRTRRGLGEDDAQWILVRGRALMTETLGPLLPGLAQTLASLSAEQRTYLAEQLDERNEAYVERNGLNLPREERLERRADRTVSQLEDWTGPLSEEQVALVHRIRNSMPDSAGAWLEYTRSQQQQLLNLLASNAGADRIEAHLRGWWLFESPVPPDLKQRRDMQMAALRQLLVELDASLDSQQRAHLVDRLDDLVSDARDLAQET